MLQKIRDRISGWIAALFLGAIAVVFIFWGIRFENSATSAAARVNGESVPLEEVRRAWQQRQTELQRDARDELPAELVRSEQRSLLDDFVRRELLRQRTDELGYRIGDQKLVATLSSIPALQVDGQFSRDRYAALLRQQGRTEAAFEADLRDDLQIGELQRGIAMSSFATPSELRRRIELEGEQRDVDFAVVPAAKFASQATVAAEDVERWYEENKARYMTPETVSLQYLQLDLDEIAAGVEVTEEALHKYYDEVAHERFVETEQRRASHILIETGDDDAAARTRAEQLLARARAGEDLAALARENSDDAGSKAQGGDLGWSTREAFVAPFAEALFALAPGELAGPVRTQFGYHLIRLDEVRPGKQRAFDEVRTELEAEFRHEQAQALFYERSQELADESFAALTELETAAQKLGLPLRTVATYTRAGGGPFGAEREVLEAVFSNEVLVERQNSAPISLGDESVVVLRVTAHEEPRQQLLADVRSDIEADLRARAAQQAATAAAEAMIARLAGGAAWNDVVAGQGLTAAGQVTVERRNAEFPPELLQAVFLAPAPADGRPSAGKAALPGGDLVVFVVNARRPGATQSPEGAAPLGEQMRATAGRAAAAEFAAYVGEVERSARIKRNEKAFE
jgi:peptidyl-prolyl cis-trans isomerase D